MLTATPRWTSADIFVSYTSSDRAGGHLGSGQGAHTARNAHLHSSAGAGFRPGVAISTHRRGCPSSDDLRHIAGFRKGGSGSSVIEIGAWLLMLQATVCDCLALDPFAFEEDGLGASEVDVSRGKIVEALVIAGMVVMRHEGG